MVVPEKVTVTPFVTAASEPEAAPADEAPNTASALTTIANAAMALLGRRTFDILGLSEGENQQTKGRTC